MKARGFTLVELVMVIVITGILAATLVVFLKPAIDSYVDTRRRAEMTDLADTALRRMAQDIRRAVPNSVRSVSSTCLQLVPTIAGGRYRKAPDTLVTTSRPIDTSGATAQFDVLAMLLDTSAPEPKVDDWLVIDNQNGDEVYTNLLDQHVKDGKPLGGTSAGLAILGQVGYGALDGTSLTSPRALADPLAASVTLDGGFLHLPFLDSVITDTHFAERNRFGRLIVFLARARHDGLIAEPLGIGVDEDTMLCIEPDGRAQVMSASGGHAWFVHLPKGSASLLAGEPL